MVMTRLEAAVRFYINGTPLPRYLGVDEFCAMQEDEFHAWCRGDDQVRHVARQRAKLSS